MKTKNRIQQSKYILTGFVMTLAAVLGAARYTETVNGITWTYTISNGEASVGGGSYSSPAVSPTTSGAIVVPSTLGGKPVTSIADSAFRGCSGLTSVIIPEGVTRIGQYAFYECSGLANVTIPDSATSIWSDAFYETPFYNNKPDGLVILGKIAYKVKGECPAIMAIPDDVTIIGNGAFSECSGLTHVTIPDSVTSIGENAFIGCSGLISVTIPDSVTSIGSGAFVYCKKLKNVIIPVGVTSIEDDTFNGCYSLEEITIPEWVRNIGHDAFYGCDRLKGMILPSSMTNIGFRAFCYCRDLTHITIPNGVTSIKWETFNGCSGLTSVTIPNSVTSIGENAFRGCTGLTSVLIPNCVTNIEISAFRNCNGLTSIVIPDKVTSIGDEAFYGCRSLKRVILADAVTNLGMGVFSNCVSLQTFTYPQNMSPPNGSFGKNAPDFTKCTYRLAATPDGSVLTVDSAPYGAFEDFEKIGRQVSSVFIQSGVTSIGERAFYGLRGMKTISIPDTVTTISTQAFGYCSSLTNVTIPNNVKSIGNGAFYGCSGVAAITLGNSVIRIGDSVFHSCTNLSSVTIPNSVRSVGNDAFYGCSGLTTVTLGCGVTNVGIRAFSNCTQMELFAVDVDNSAYKANAGMLFTRNGDMLVSVPGGMTHVTLPDDMTSIAAYAFCGCGGIDRLTIPNSVTNLGTGVFMGCDSILDISMPARLMYRSVAGIAPSKLDRRPIKVDDYDYVSTDGLDIDIELYGDQDIWFDWEISSSRVGSCATWSLDGVQKGRVECVDTDYYWNYVYRKWWTKMSHISSGKHNIQIRGASVRFKLKNIANLFPDSYDRVERIIFTDDATEIPYETFAGCASLVSAQLPNTITNIGDRAFRDCTSIKSIAIPDGVQSIGDVFEGCNSLEYVNLPEGLISICDNAFKGCGNLAEISIPTNVTSIGAAAFSDCTRLIAVTIPSSVTSIGNSAFSGCSNLMEMTIPNSVTNIGASAFYDCGGLTSMAIPGSVTHIGLGAFKNCNMLTNFTVSGESPVYISQNGLLLSHDGKTIVCGVNGNVVIPDTVTDVGDSSFSGCSGLTSIKIPNSVTNIGTWAFANCTGLTTVEIPDSVIGLGWNGSFYTAFYGCNRLRQVTVPQYVCKRKLSSFLPSACNSIENVIISDNVTYISSEAFSGCGNLVSIYIPNSVTNIKVSTFSACRKLKNATLPQDVLSSKVSSVFESCYQTLTNIVVQDGVTNIGNQAFSGCNKLKSVMIPESVRSIGDFSFSGCGELAKLQFKGDAPKLGSYVLQNVPADCCAYVRHLSSGWGSTIPGKWNGIDIDYLDSIVAFDANGGVGGVTNMLERGAAIVAPTVTRTGYTFTGWSPNVAATVPPSNVTYTAQWEINRYIVTFDANGGVGETNLVFEHGMPLVTPEVTRTNYDFRCWCRSANGGAVWRDGMSVTSDMTLYAQWTLQPNVWLYDVEDGKARITRYSTPTGDIIVPAEIDGYPVTAIEASVFSYRTGLTSVTIPDGVTSIDDESFRNCSALTNVWIGSGVMYIGTNAFRDCYALLNVEIGGGVTVVGNSAFRGCSRLSDITIPAGVNTIENYAFAECNSLGNVVIPDSVGFIGPSAFSSCGGLTNVTIGTGVTRIGSYAFRYCSRLVTVVFEGKCPSNMGSSVFGGVSPECCAYIHRASRGWGTVIPRSWNGITLDYIQHDVFFVANGGTCNVSSVSVADGLPIGILPTPVLTNAVFLGWFTSADGGSQMDEAMIVTQSTKLYAHWLPQTLNEAMDVDVSVRLATSEVNPWMPVFDSTAKVGDTTARSGAIGDKTNTWITATVSGAGTMSFWLKTSCEYDDEENAMAADRLMIYTNGVEIVEWRMDGETDWTQREVSFAGGENTVKWVYCKDKSGVGGEDCAWVDGVMWTLTDPIPPIVSDGEVLTALAGATDVNLAANVTNAAQYTAYRAWALSVTNDTTTAQMVKESTRTWLSYAFAADALIDKELTSDDVKIELFTPASTDGKFEFTVSVKDVNIGGGSVAVETLKENLKKVLGIEGSATLSPGGFSSDNIDITFDTPVDGKARFFVSPPADAGNSFFMRVKVK